MAWIYQLERLEEKYTLKFMFMFYLFILYSQNVFWIIFILFVPVDGFLIVSENGVLEIKIHCKKKDGEKIGSPKDSGPSYMEY